MRDVSGSNGHHWGDPWTNQLLRRKSRSRPRPVCPQCGGKILAEPTAAARVIECVCLVCNSQLVLTRQAEGDVRVTVGSVDPRSQAAAR